MLSKLELESILERVHEWTRAVDQKVSIFLAFQGIAIAILFEKTLSWIENNFAKFSWVSIWIVLSGLFLVSYSIYKSISVIIPRLVGSKKDKSLIYFGNIAELSIEDFKKEMKKMRPEKYEDELINQTHISSKIALRKHKQFRDAIIIFFIGMCLLIIIYLLYKCGYGN